MKSKNFSPLFHIVAAIMLLTTGLLSSCDININVPDNNPSNSQQNTSPNSNTSSSAPSSNQSSSSSNKVSLDFWADETTVKEGECTVLHWNTSGGNAYLQGIQQASSGKTEVCPKKTTEYRLELEDKPDHLVDKKVITINVSQSSSGSSSSNNSSSSSSNSNNSGSNNTQSSSSFTFTFVPKKGPAGTDVTLTLSKAIDVVVYYEGQPLPKKVSKNGKKVTVTIPTGSFDGYFTVEGNGKSVRASEPFVVEQDTQVLIAETKADLQITDLFPEHMPVGDVYFRLTNHGPNALVQTKVEYYCDAMREAIPGIVAVGDPVKTSGSVMVTQKPGETKIYATGISIDTDVFKYDISCTLTGIGGLDDNPSNNTYWERIP